MGVGEQTGAGGGCQGLPTSGPLPGPCLHDPSHHHWGLTFPKRPPQHPSPVHVHVFCPSPVLAGPALQATDSLAGPEAKVWKCQTFVFC